MSETGHEPDDEDPDDESPDDESVDDEVTLGGPVLFPAIPTGPLFVGPPDDPDRFELQDDGTRGGEGRTWRAVYRGGLNTPLAGAIKMLFPPEGAAANWPTEADMRRWHDNATLLRHLAQPHVVQLHDIFGGAPPHPQGAAEGAGRSVAYLLMEWIDGPTLAALLRGRPVSASTLAERLTYIDDIATAVASLHSHTRSAGNPALHRDITPANCIVNPARGIVLIDISGMRLVDDGFDPLGRHTPAYTAPEVLRTPHIARDPSSDLFSVGAVALFCLTGQDPSAEPEARAGQTAQLEALLKQAGAAAPEAAAVHVARLMHAEPAQRPADILAWSRTLSELAAPKLLPPQRGRPRRPVLVGAAGVLAAALATAGTVYAVQHDGPSRSSSLKAASTPSPSASPTTNTTLGPVLSAATFAPHDFYSTAGSIDSPGTGAQVRDCEYFSGTAAKLPPGQTLVVSEHQIGGHDTIRFIEVTFGFDKPETLSTWHTVHFFNQAAIGEDMLIELIELPLTPELVKADNDKRFDISSALAAKGKILAAATVHHIDKKNPSPTCDAPAG